MADNWVRIVNTTIADYIRGEENNILRNRKLLALLKSRGRITFNHSGTEMDWKVRYKRAPMTGYADGDTLSFARKDRHKTAKLDWRGYSATDSISKMERLQNSGTEAIIKLFSTMAQTLMEDITENFGDEFYVDGNAAGNGKRMHGFESFFGTSGSAATGVAAPSDTYAGLNTGLGYYGGNWTQNASPGTTDWPTGTGDPQYDFWSPLVIDYTNTGWAGATNTWAANCTVVMRYALTHQGRNASKDAATDTVFLDPELYRQFAQAQDSRQQIHITRGDKPGGLVALGFTDVINFDGVEVTREYGVPRNSGYGLPIGQIELRSMQGTLFESDKDFELSTKSNRFSIDFLGNMRCNPKFFTKFKNIS